MAATPAAEPAWPCLSPHGNGVRLAVSVQPNARSTTADGLHDGTLRIRLGAPPVDGKANQLLIDWLADELGLPKRKISLVRGEASRRKFLEIDAPLAVVSQWLSTTLASRAGK
jgi:uncharacterized protein (TIGR00251 family)